MICYYRLFITLVFFSWKLWKSLAFSRKRLKILLKSYTVHFFVWFWSTQPFKHFNCFQMHLFISDFGMLNPLFCMVGKKICKIVFQVRIFNYFLNKTVVIFLPRRKQFHFTVQKFWIFLIFHWFQIIQKSFNKIFW